MANIGGRNVQACWPCSLKFILKEAEFKYNQLEPMCKEHFTDRVVNTLQSFKSLGIKVDVEKHRLKKKIESLW